MFEVQIVEGGSSEVATITQANPAAINILHVPPLVGRLLRPDEDVRGADVHKALISHALWQGRFASDPAIVGKTLTTDRRVYTIVGVMPPGFAFPAQTSVWTPMESWYASQTDDRAIKRRDARFYSAIARIKPGISVRQRGGPQSRRRRSRAPVSGRQPRDPRQAHQPSRFRDRHLSARAAA